MGRPPGSKNKPKAPATPEETNGATGATPKRKAGRPPGKKNAATPAPETVQPEAAQPATAPAAPELSDKASVLKDLIAGIVGAISTATENGAPMPAPDELAAAITSSLKSHAKKSEPDDTEKKEATLMQFGGTVLNMALSLIHVKEFRVTINDVLGAIHLVLTVLPHAIAAGISRGSDADKLSPGVAGADMLAAGARLNERLMEMVGLPTQSVIEATMNELHERKAKAALGVDGTPPPRGRAQILGVDMAKPTPPSERPNKDGSEVNDSEAWT